MTLPEHQAFRIWFWSGIDWFVLMVLLALTVGSAFIPMGVFNGIINMAIAAIKVIVVLLFFMKLRWSSPLLRLTAGAGVLWLIFMFALSGSDYFTRF